MKKLVSWLLVLSMLLCCLAAASAETTVTTVDLSGLYYPSLNTYVSLIYARESRESGYAIYDLSGNPITGNNYAEVSANEYGFKVKNGEGLEGFVDVGGTELVPTEYGDVDACSAKWQAGVRLVPATSDNYDYYTIGGSEKTFYLIDTVDIFYCGQKVGTLDRADYTSSCNAYGDYLYVRNRDGKWHFYDSAFNESGYEAEYGSSEYDRIYKDGKYTYYHCGSGQEAFTAGCTLTPDQVKTSVAVVNGVLLDLQGNEIATLQYDSIYGFSGGYARVKNEQGLEGLINEQGEEVLPCIYDSLSYDGPCCGYISAVKDGKQGFVKLSDGSETGFVYPEESVKVRGAFAYLQDLDGTIIVETAGAGILQDRYIDYHFSYSGQTPVAVLMNADGSCGVVGLFGEEVVPFNPDYDRTYDLDVSEDGHAVLADGSTLYVIDYDYDQTVAAEDGPWTCPSCGNVNDADFAFCPKDATPRP